LILDKKLFLICILNCTLSVFYLLTLFFPFRMIINVYDYGGHFNLAETFIFHIYVSIIFSRGFLLYLPGLVLFGLSAIVFLVFSFRGSRRLAKIGFIFGIVSGGLFFSSGIILLIIYNDQITSILPIMIIFATSLSQINFNIAIFTMRNAFLWN